MTTRSSTSARWRGTWHLIYCGANPDTDIITASDEVMG
jgi:hypothetical protein